MKKRDREHQKDQLPVIILKLVKRRLRRKTSLIFAYLFQLTSSSSFIYNSDNRRKTNRKQKKKSKGEMMSLEEALTIFQPRDISEEDFKDMDPADVVVERFKKSVAIFLFLLNFLKV